MLPNNKVIWQKTMVATSILDLFMVNKNNKSEPVKETIDKN